MREYESRSNEFQEAMAGIHISGQMQEEIIRNVRRRAKRGGRHTGWRRFAVSAAAVLVALGVVSVPVSAAIRHYRNAYENPNIRTRVETTMTGEEIQEFYRMFDLQDKNGVNADTFSREYVGTERERVQTLWNEYETGAASPKGSIPMAASAEEAGQYDFCYLTALARFYLPQDRELTNEEILQMIELQRKCQYVIEKRTFERK